MTGVKALSITQRKSFKLTILDFPEPKLAPGEFLIENVAVAQNPVDWKQVLYDTGIPQLPWTNGADVAGTIVKVGPSVKGFAVGDRVLSFLSRQTARHGAYQTHSISSADRTVKVPSNYTFEQASTVPLGYVTAGASLVATLGVSLPTTSDLRGAGRRAIGKPLLVWGGSSSVGAFAVQLGKLAGYTVISTASPANHAYVRSLGASEVFDYHSADVVANIRAAAGPNLSLVFDAISENGSLEASAAAITASKGVVASVLGAAKSPLPHVKIIASGARLAYEQPDVGKKIFEALQGLLDRGELIPNPVRIMPGGLNGVEAGWELGRTHAISGEKLVYRITDTIF